MSCLFFLRGKSRAVWVVEYFNEEFDVCVSGFGLSSVSVCDSAASEEIDTHLLIGCEYLIIIYNLDLPVSNDYCE